MAGTLVSTSPRLGNPIKPALTRNKRSYIPVVVRGASLLTCIVLWHVASTNKWNGIVNFENVPSPATVCQAAIQLVNSPKFENHLLSSIARVFLGFGCATVLAITIGLGVGRSKFLSDLLMPPLELLRPIPAVAWIPLAVLVSQPGREHGLHHLCRSVPSNLTEYDSRSELRRPKSDFCLLDPGS
jgi:ABC-type nitrate/sulfonate/bicarbonate transport system permease component